MGDHFISGLYSRSGDHREGSHDKTECPSELSSMPIPFSPYSDNPCVTLGALGNPYGPYSHYVYIPQRDE